MQDIYYFKLKFYSHNLWNVINIIAKFGHMRIPCLNWFHDQKTNQHIHIVQLKMCCLNIGKVPLTKDSRQQSMYISIKV